MFAASLAAALPGRVLFNAGEKPYVSIRMEKKDDPVDLITRALDLGVQSGS